MPMPVRSSPSPSPTRTRSMPRTGNCSQSSTAEREPRSPVSLRTTFRSSTSPTNDLRSASCRCALENGTVTFAHPGSGPRTVIAVESSKLAHARRWSQNEPSDLDDSPGADVVIISHPSFVAALDPLVKLRQSEGLSVLVVKIDDIYDEFNYGAKDPQAIQSFLRNARRWETPPRYVLLVGDASFDERQYLGLGDFDFVPTKLVMADLLVTSSDAWFTDFDDDGTPDIPIGRLSARC